MIRITRISCTMASTILRKFSACASLRSRNLSLSSLDTPSTNSATELPKWASKSSLVTSQSSITSCSSAACSVSRSRRISARIRATATG
ncbi:Uncharacterised protein [Vibrio cholerae]|nr:Uncharacterised protein [Vibrio cholerae]